MRFGFAVSHVPFLLHRASGKHALHQNPGTANAARNLDNSKNKGVHITATTN